VIAGKAEVMKPFDAKDPPAGSRSREPITANPQRRGGDRSTIERPRKNDGEVYRHLEALFARKGRKAVASRIGSAFRGCFAGRVPSDGTDWPPLTTSSSTGAPAGSSSSGASITSPLTCKQGSFRAALAEAEVDLPLERTEEALNSL